MHVNNIGIPARPLQPSCGKRTGVQQAEHRLARLVSDLERQRTAALTLGRSGQARRFATQRAGALAALDLIQELLRNYEGRE